MSGLSAELQAEAGSKTWKVWEPEDHGLAGTLQGGVQGGCRREQALALDIHSLLSQVKCEILETKDGHSDFALTWSHSNSVWILGPIMVNSKLFIIQTPTALNFSVLQPLLEQYSSKVVRSASPESLEIRFPDPPISPQPTSSLDWFSREFVWGFSVCPGNLSPVSESPGSKGVGGADRQPRVLLEVWKCSFFGPISDRGTLVSSLGPGPLNQHFP